MRFRLLISNVCVPVVGYSRLTLWRFMRTIAQNSRNSVSQIGLVDDRNASTDYQFKNDTASINEENDHVVQDSTEKRVGLTQREQRKLLRCQPLLSDNQKLLKAAIIGSPNAGKSTLLNRLIGWKVAPVSQKVHTTRYRTLGVLTEDEKQVVFLDTPGVIVPGKLKRHHLETSLLIDPHAALFDADIVVVVVDASAIWHRFRLDPEILKLLHVHDDKPSVLVLNKVDVIPCKQNLLSVVRRLTAGAVGNHRSKSPAVKQKNANIDSVAANRSTHKMKSMETEFFDLKESCRRLQNGNGFSVDNYESDDDDKSDNISEARHNVNNADDGPVEIKSIAQLRHLNRPNHSKPNSTFDRDSDSEYNGNYSHRVTVNTSDELYTPSGWDAYFKRLNEIASAVEGKHGWAQFDTVFMVSALDGDGVNDLKSYLLHKTYQHHWIYSSSVVTDQNPIVLAKMIIRKRLLDHLPDEVPYNIHVKLNLWEITDSNYLRAAFDIVCTNQRHMRKVLQKIREIASESKQELMNAFRREMTLKLAVRISSGNNS